YASLELRCDFPNAALPDGRLIRPEGLTIPLEGKRPALPARKAIASTRDQIFEMTVVGQSVATEFAGAKAADNHRFLVLDVTVKNLGGQHQEFFQPREQLKYATEAGQQLKMDDATLKGPQPPAEAVYIPAGDRRTFQVAYQIPAEDSRPRLSYASVTEGMSKVLPLQPLEKSVAAARPAPMPGAPEQPPAAPAKPEPPMKTVARADPPQPGVSIPGDKPIKALRVAAKQDRKPLGIAGVGLTADQVNTAIDTGAAALWELLKSDELKKDNDLNARHEDVLVALALVHCGFHKKSPEFDAALRRFLESAKPREMGTYRAGLLAMLIEGYGDSQYVPKMRDAARYLLEGEGPDGTWGYTPNVPPEIFEKINTKHGVLRVEGGTPIGKPAEPWVRLTKPQVPGGDNSVTQYALLGLSTASRSGMKMPADVWKAALATATARQGTDGGWGYSTNGGRSYGSMSAAGICAVAIARYELGEAEPLKDETLERGIAWLANNFHVNLHPGNEGEWYYYYMYSIERVGRILDTEFIGEHEWYPVGARTLVSKQDADHLWKAPQGQERDPRLASSFALLFLTRATPSLIAGPEKRGGSGALIATATPPANRLYMILDASGSMLDNMDGQLKFDAARNAVWALVKDLPEKSDVALRVYGHRKRATDKGADQDTELLIPMGPLNKDAFHGKLDALRSRGKTPLALSLEQALADIRNGDPKHPVTVVLLTDGGEDTVPPRNPVKTAALLKDRKDIRFHIIGFDINQEEWSRQLQAMGTASGGDYWPAVKAADLERSLKVAVLATPESFEVLDAAGHVVASGAFGEKVNLHEGQYTFRTNLAGRAFSQDVWVNTDGTTSVDFNGEEALASLATAPASAPPAPGPAVTENPPSPRPATPTPSARKFCTHCGGPLKPGQKFCPSCGMAVEK
ncbi:MAG: Prenyltransferase and squalene oxidase repeat protein, partial [Phycisphaerales bacterium]|nr:Prenyltransferase and squalene oxidase repeat protein [Phycisphaerales bacterium]